MEINELQALIGDRFNTIIEAHSSEYGIARLLEQSGQLAESLITRGSRDVRKEIGDVLLVLVCIASKERIDLESLVRHDLLRRKEGYYLEGVIPKDGGDR
jgi:NTP pyrophosphatase (non-canonical NTP hydrolase)